MEHFAIYARQELADVQAQMDAVQQQMAPLQQTFAGLQAQAEALTTYLAVAAPRPPATGPAPGGIVVSLIEQVLRRAGGPLHYKEIMQRLQTEEGYTMPGRDPTANLTARLSKWPQFVRVAPGTYTLRTEAV